MGNGEPGERYAAGLRRLLAGAATLTGARPGPISSPGAAVYDDDYGYEEPEDREPVEALIGRTAGTLIRSSRR